MDNYNIKLSWIPAVVYTRLTGAGMTKNSIIIGRVFVLKIKKGPAQANPEKSRTVIHSLVLERI